MSDSAERAARRIYEGFEKHSGFSVDEIAAIIREELARVLRECLDDDGKWIYCTVSRHDKLAKVARSSAQQNGEGK
jgi:hypothetical protein